ncbi:hypothetical protein LCGC14_1272070 [marine sediment metagenome]|uniref:Uncharacterized protein n=1 Tax=marine sediment metagenome TaxID=412755 RepID=A0A0F9KXS9_9ZZZZ
MRIFNEERKNNEIVFLLSHKEVREIYEALEEACKHRKRKLLWKKILNQIYSEAGIY